MQHFFATEISFSFLFFNYCYCNNSFFLKQEYFGDDIPEKKKLYFLFLLYFYKQCLITFIIIINVF